MSDDDCVEVHGFLCVISQPVLFAPIDAQDSINEVLRLRDEGVILVARMGGHIIGSLGLIRTGWWYNQKSFFLTDRWFFVFPQFHHVGVAARLLAEAAVIGAHAEIPVVINGHMRKGRGPGNVYFTRPRVISPPAKDRH